jgi:hypothetical protein
VSENSREVTAALLGAVGGAALGYLLFTDRGRRLRRELEAALDDALREVNSFRAAVRDAANLASEGWKLLNEAVDDASTADPQYSNARQSAPF